MSGKIAAPYLVKDGTILRVSSDMSTVAEKVRNVWPQAGQTNLSGVYDDPVDVFRGMDLATRGLEYQRKVIDGGIHVQDVPFHYLPITGNQTCISRFEGDGYGVITYGFRCENDDGYASQQSQFTTQGVVSFNYIETLVATFPELFFWDPLLLQEIANPAFVDTLKQMKFDDLQIESKLSGFGYGEISNSTISKKYAPEIPGDAPWTHSVTIVNENPEYDQFHRVDTLRVGNIEQTLHVILKATPGWEVTNELIDRPVRKVLMSEARKSDKTGATRRMALMKAIVEGKEGPPPHPDYPH